MAVSTLDLERSLLFPLSTGRARPSSPRSPPPPSANGSAWPRPRGARRRPMGAAADAAFMRGSCGEGERERGRERERGLATGVVTLAQSQKPWKREGSEFDQRATQVVDFIALCLDVV